MSAQPSIRWAWVWRWLVRGATALLVVVALLLGLLAAVFYTEPGTRFALTQGVSFYDGLIPGAATMGSVDGTLAGGTTLRGVRLEDRTGRPLVTTDVLRLRVDPLALPRLQVRPGTVSLEGVRVYVIDATEGGFADLGPAGPPSPPEPSPNFGPDLPLSIVGAVEVTDAVLLRVTPGLDPLPWIEVPHLSAAVDAEGLGASIGIEGVVAMPDQDLHIDGLKLDAYWSDPEATVRGLLVQSNAGTLAADVLALDLARERFEVEGLALQADAGWLGRRTGIAAADDIELTMAAAGSTQDFTLDAWLHMPDGGSAAIALAGAVEPSPDIQLLLDAALAEDPALAFGGVIRSPAEIHATATARGELAVGGEVTLKARCEGCVEDLGGLDVDAEGFVGLEHEWGRARVDVRAKGVDVVASALALPGGLAAAQTQLKIEELRALKPLLDRFAPDLDLAGGLRVDALCGAQVDLAVGGCRAVLDLERGQPVRAAHLDAFAWTPGPERLAATVNALRVEAGDARVELQGPGAQLRLAQDIAQVEALALRVSNATGDGRVSARGRVELQAPRSLDASLRVQELSLAAINAFVPQLDAAGVLTADATVRGPIAAPRVQASVSGRGLAGFGVDVGTLELDANYRDERATAQVEVAGADVGELSLEGSIPISVNLEQGGAELYGRRAARVELSLNDAPLHTAGTFVPRLRSLRGTLATHVTLDGSLRRPTLAARVDVVEGSLDGNRLPDVEVDVHYAGALAGVELAATHPSAFDRVALDAQLPVTLNLRRGRARWLKREPHKLSVQIEGAQLAEVGVWAPSVHAKGEVDASLELEGDMFAPKIRSVVQARDVVYEDKPVGETSLRLAYADELAELQLHAAGPEVSGVGVVAEVPVTLVPASGVARWRSDEAHRVRVSVNELLLEEAMRWVPPPDNAPQDPIALAGRLSATLALDGRPASPLLTAGVEVDAARFGGRKLGRVELDARYADARAQADLVWRKTSRHTATVGLDIPVRLDLKAQSFVWEQQGEHHLRVAAPQIDREMLDPFIDTGDFNAAAALHMVADGHPEAFTAGASLVGVVRGHGETHRVRADLDLDQDDQTLALDLGLGHGAKQSSWAHVDAAVHASVPALLRGADWRTTPFEVSADVRDVDLRQLSALAPVAVQDVRGTLGVHAVVDGTLGTPRIDGNVTLDGGEVTVVAARQRFKDVELVASLTNDRIEVSRLRMNSAGGSLRGRGAVSISQGLGLAGRIDLKADRLPIRSPGLPRMTFTGDIGTKLDVGITSSSVDVEVAAARVDVFTSRIKAAAAIPTNDNVGFVDFDEPPPREVTFIPAETPPSTRSTHIKVALVDPVKIIGPSVDMEWDGVVEAGTAEAGGATAEGALRAQGGGFELLGNEFKIDQGEVTLPEDGSNVPFINLAAVTQVEDVSITASIRGALPKPELELSSTPSMSQSDIFTVLVTGSTDTQEADPDEVEAKAAGLLAAMTNPALQQQLNDTLKVDKIGVGFGDSTDQPILTVGKHVSKDVYAETEYHHNAPQNENRAELRVEYDFAPRWSLETFFGDAAAGGVDVFWGRAFDTKRNATR